MRAYAILRGCAGLEEGGSQDIVMTKSEILIGREEQEEEKQQVVGISRSKKVSRIAAKIAYNERNE